MAINLTDAQQLAVDKKGNVLVAAAAGSGKTAVLVERVIKMLCSKTDPVRADRLLIVTFTNAAAAEMRGRIEKRLDEECRKNPEDTSILMQKYMLSSAKICTIDSFCIELVRENFEKLDISPDFALSDGNALKPINQRVLNEVLAPFFEEKDPVFMSLLDIVGAEFDEGRLTDLILGIYEYSRQLPFPKAWFEKLPEFYGGGEFKADGKWRNYAVKRAESAVNSAVNSLVNAVDLVTVHPKTADKYLPVFADTGEKLNALKNAVLSGDWDKIFETLNYTELLNLPRTTVNSDIPEISAVKEIYAHINKSLESIKTLVYGDSEYISAQFKKLYGPLNLLSEILIEFDDRVFEALREENMFTFHHTENMALNLLCELNGDRVEIKESALELSEYYEEVCVDEYQDTNDLQNMLFYVLSNKDSRLFAVGDVKQSIYGFRGANPKNFLDKKNSRKTSNDAVEGEPLKIILGNNFRSRPEVCDFANYFFELFMTEETGSIVYDGEERLIPSGKFPKTDFPSVGLQIITSKESETNAKILEARGIADFIKETMAGGKVIRESEDTLRNANYSDFTILLRSMKNNATVFAEELRRQGIPVNYSKEGFCEFTEIAIMLSLLKVIDNPNSDVELLTVMMSPIFGFSAEDLAKLRIENEGVSLYSAVIASAQKGNERCGEMLSVLQKFRLFAVTNTLPRLMDILLEETGFINTVSALPDGEHRRDNLRLLCEYAKGYSVSANANVGGFVDYILKQNESGIKSATASSGEDAVKIMSIHASKGLQFPVCIIAGTATGFNNSESRDNGIYLTEWGLGFKYFNEETKTPCTSLGREVILDVVKRERLQEELRLFYVAMTRTQDILHFTGVVSDIEKKSTEMVSRLLASNCRIDGDLWSKTKSYLDWLLSAVMLHPDGKALRGNGIAVICNETQSHIKVTVTDGESLGDAISHDTNAYAEPNQDLLESLKKNFAYSYPFEALNRVQSKVSVSVLANKAESEKYSFTSKPSFMSDGGITATGRGTAMHKVMEYFDFSKWQTPEEEIERLCEWQFISEIEAKSINIDALKKFFESDVFARIQRAKTVKQEMRFLTELPAKLADEELGDEFPSETVIVRGAVDVCFEEEDGIVVLDFKTDRVDCLEALAEAYGGQLHIYALACEKIFQKPVKERIIYSFAKSSQIKV